MIAISVTCHLLAPAASAGGSLMTMTKKIQRKDRNNHEISLPTHLGARRNEMKLNHMICPRCGHDFYTDCAYGTCDACNTMFYAHTSCTSNPPLDWTIRTYPTFTITPSRSR